MRTIREAADELLAGRRVAVTGVSRHPGTHAANAVAARLRDRGYEVFAVNPNADEVDGFACHHDLKSIPGGVDWVLVGTRPELALDTVKECEELGIRKVWMHRGPGRGSASPEAAAWGREHGLTVIDGGCPCMFAPTADPGHRVMRAVLSLTGTKAIDGSLTASATLDSVRLAPRPAPTSDMAVEVSGAICTMSGSNPAP